VFWTKTAFHWLVTGFAWATALAILVGEAMFVFVAGRGLVRRWRGRGRARVVLEAIGVLLIVLLWVGEAQNVP
jgi:hypothetical protein